jgi:hypothetical protein
METNVKILGYDIPEFELPSNFEFVSLGKQRGPDYWSDDMIDFFSTCTDDYFYFPTEDMFILEPVDVEILEYAINLFECNLDSNLLRFCLANDIQHRPYNTIHDYDRFQLIERTQDSDYRNGVVASIWHRENFLKQLKPGITPWKFELNTGRNNNMTVLGTKGAYALAVGHGYKRGKKILDWYKCCCGDSVKLNKADINLLETRNWVPTI